MKILTFNCGSSSLTFKVFDIVDGSPPNPVFSGKAHRVGVKGSKPSSIEFHHELTNEQLEIPLSNHGQAALMVLDKLRNLNVAVDYIGHRWGHAAGYFTTAWITDDVLAKLKSLTPMLPIHHPAMLKVITQCRKTYPDLPQYVTADGAFHSTIPPCAYTYALPEDIAKKYGFRKHGFHGLSYQYVVRSASEFLGLPLERLKIVACHLGTGGSSVAAIKYGASVDTSMGYTGLPGLIMSTRSGDIDPILSTYLMANYGYRPDDLLDQLNKKSGLLGISGFSSDIRDIIQKISDDPKAKLAFDMYVYRIRKYIGSYGVLMGGVDLLIFTDDIGAKNWLVRERVCNKMDWLDAELDGEENKKCTGEEISVLQTDSSRVKIIAMPTEEELVICWEGLKLLRRGENAVTV